jgi:hypothetical protein
VTAHRPIEAHGSQSWPPTPTPTPASWSAAGWRRPNTTPDDVPLRSAIVLVAEVAADLEKTRAHSGSLPPRGLRGRPVLVEDHVPGPVQLVLDAPVALDPRGQSGWWCARVVGGGDHVDDLDALAALSETFKSCCGQLNEGCCRVVMTSLRS